ncbi:sce7725 family protein [Clavibacter michiganensis]|uniref:sce7725 family protein n=1 Tax=Clavibacter michiganensis TaxID=28447 RepID=UPI0013660B1B|nr:sce7725 family protein [Clavibacter michiganensis]MDO4040040.1 sce7725 family protein [Clavibacter michiganensis]MDO4059284.1 sce7725 family protein [Clavibacter michiganensis]MDO4077241.1 sce7725 family protein [Clavibacter michiganensis]MDO4092410.1 sce7725 family protein [Clavibacter michiganensis]MDO4101583.1 sce7725 family protein [Clavibacter michiganensis]
MYFPYLYARRAERNALSELYPAMSGPQKTFPILEPFSRAEDLDKVLQAFKGASARIYLVVNPHNGFLQSPGEQALWGTRMTTHIADATLVIPTLKVTAASSIQDITSFLSTYSGRATAIAVFEANRSLSASAIAGAVGNHLVVVFVGPRLSVIDYESTLGANRVVALEQRFTVRRNADYPHESAYSRDPATYSAGGRLGFGDFTILDPKIPRIKSGGAAAGAVAVHITYQDPTSNDVKIQHFLSSSQIQGTPPDALKLLEALNAMNAQHLATPHRFLQSPGYKALEDYRARGYSTSLEKSKQSQINHHIFAISSAL